MATIPQDEAAAIRAKLDEYEVPTNALARVFGMSPKNMDNFLSGRFNLPVPLADALKGILNVREEGERRRQEADRRRRCVPPA